MAKNRKPPPDPASQPKKNGDPGLATVSAKTVTVAADQAVKPDQPDKQVDVPDGWYRNSYTRYVAHTVASERYRDLSRWTGGIAVVLATIAGTTLVTNLTQSEDSTLNAVAAVLALLSALAASLQTFAGYGQLAADHHNAAVAYGELKRDFELINEEGGTIAKSEAVALKKKYRGVEEAAPTLRKKYWEYGDHYTATRLRK
jgi:hypothetical protein